MHIQFSPSHFRHLLIAALLCFAIFPAFTQSLQITGGTTPPFTPQNLISNVFLGDGVEVTDIQFAGVGTAVGYFTGGTNVIGLERGIIMTSGRAATSGSNLGADQVGNQQANVQNASPVSDADLSALTTAGTQNVAKYTIKFIPTSDTLRFRYCFASEEYPEFACSGFNDVFGFFIQGPGYPVPTNIAKIPGTSLPVTINNVHPANPAYGCGPLNEQYYNSNNGTTFQPVYDGFTDVFIAEAIVTPCEEYTIKLAIADVSDEIYDSGVFLEAKSFGTGSLFVEAVTISNDGTITEGCAAGELNFQLPNPAAEAINIDFNVWGSATNGIDYQAIPSFLGFAQGEKEITIPIIAFEDGIAEGTEFIAIDVQLDPCNRDTFYLYIRENGLVPPHLQDDSTLCIQGNIPLELNGTLPIPLPDPPTFSNTNDMAVSTTNTAYFSPINVFGIQPTVLGPGMIKSVCVNFNHTWIDDIDMYLISPGGQFIELTTDNGGSGNNYTNTCFSPTATTKISFPGPYAPSSAAPFTGDWQPEGVWSDLWDGTFPSNGTWQLQIIDDQTGFSGTLLDWSMTFEPSYQVNYSWSPTTGLDCPTCPITNALPDQSTTYTIEATDTYGCVVKDSVKLDVILGFEAPLVTCSNTTNNSISFSWADVPGATTYEVNVNGTGWITPSGPGNTHTIGGLLPQTTITIEVRATGGPADCLPAIGTSTCTNCQQPVVDIVENPVTCFGFTNGSAALTPDGVNPPYLYSIGAVSNSNGLFTDLAAGNYVATITDQSGCSVEKVVVINSPTALNVIATLTDSVNCFGGNNGILSAIGSGGTGNLDFLWNDISGQTTAIATGLSAGNYSVTITDDNGCSQTATAQVFQPDALLTNSNFTNPACFGGQTGDATLQVSGGTGPYTALWTGGLQGLSQTGLLAGNYSATISDANGCTSTEDMTLTEPPVLNATTDVSPVICFGETNGSSTAIPTGGTTPYTFIWSDPAGQSTPIAGTLAAGNYTVTITDDHGCTQTANATITQPPAISLATSGTDALCFGQNNGTATVNASGGTGTLGYSWNDPANQQTATATLLAAGTYTVTVTDQNLCTQEKTLSIGQPLALQSTLTPHHVGCSGQASGGADIVATGGTGPYNFLWSTGEITPSITGLTPGNVTVTITDAQGCSKTETTEILDAISIQYSFNVDPVKCFGQNTGSLSVNLTGGTGGLTVNWTGPGGFTATGPYLSNLSAGTYTFVATDALGCSRTASEDVEQPAAALEVDLPFIADTVCFGSTTGLALAQASGGTPPLQYNWSTGATGAQLTGVGLGIYQVTITDNNGCQAKDSTFIQQQNELFAILGQQQALCHDGANGSAEVQVVYYGLNAADLTQLHFQWNTVPPQNTVIANGLQGGNSYTVTVTDHLGCTDVQTIAVENPEGISAQIDNTQPVSCFGGNDGSASASALGGTGTFTYNWSPNSGNQTGITAVNLAAGTYNVTAVDQNNCHGTVQVIIGQPPEIKNSFLKNEIKCFGEATGEATAFPTGGAGNFNFQWENGSSTAKTQGLTAGYHRITLTDQNGCNHVDSILLRQPDTALEGLAEVQDATCFGAKNGKIMIHGTGGTLPYEYGLNGQQWNGSTIQIGLGAGQYTPYVRDGNGCIAPLPEVEVQQRNQLTVDLGPDFTIQLGQDTSLSALITNATQPVEIYWSTEDSLWLSCLFCATPDVDSLYFENSFEIYIVDSTGCSAEDRVTIKVEKVRRVFVPTGFSPNGDNANELLSVYGQEKVKILEFKVFDRWGEKLFEAHDFDINDATIGWDGNFRGKAMDPGVYVWTLKVQYRDQVTEFFKGNTTLLR